MSGKTALAASIQSCADGSGDLALRIAIGATGGTVQFRGETRTTGLAYAVPGMFDCVLTGVGQAVDSRAVVAQGLTNSSGSTLNVGHAVRISANNALNFANASASGTALGFIGLIEVDVANSAVAEVRTGNIATGKFVNGLTLSAGNLVYLSTTNGLLTNVAPSVAGQVRLKVGIVSDSSSYASNQTAKVVLLIGEPVIL